MYAKQMIIFLLVGYGILAPDIIFGFEIISTTTERNVNKDGRCQQEIIQTLGDNLREQQKHFDEKIGKIETQLVNIQELLKQFKKENLGEVVHVKTNLPKNCMEVLKRGNTLSGVYTIKPVNTNFEVWCDMDTGGGGWTYVLNRFDGSQDFYLDWKHYRNGFGNLTGEFWLGLQHLHELTGSQNNQLLLEFVTWSNNKQYHVKYNTFSVGSEEEGYPLKRVDGYSGFAGNSFVFHRYAKFSTFDNDQDDWKDRNCAVKYHGAWWFGVSRYCDLSGDYFKKKPGYTMGVFCYIEEEYTRLKKAKMMVRPG